MAAVLGVDPWRTPYDVWAEKSGKLIEAEPTDVMLAGNRFEDGVLDYAEERLGPLLRNVHLTCPGTPLAANVDALVKEDTEPVEAKTAGLFGPLKDRWGDEGTDEIPDRVIVQCHVEMLCRVGDEVDGTGLAAAYREATCCHVGAFLGGRGFGLFVVPRNKSLCDIILDEAAKFWTCVERDTPPAGAVGTPHVLKLMRREPEKIVSIDPAIVRTWLDAKAALKAAGEHEEQAKAAVLTAMGNGEAALCGDLGALTYLTVNRKGYTVQPSSYRQLRHKPKGL